MMLPTAPAARSPAAQPPDRTRPSRADTVLTRHSEDGSTTREVIVRPTRSGDRLVIDRDLATGRQQRLLGRLHPDEPASNAAVLCERYLATPPGSRRCRPPHVCDELPAQSAAPEPDLQADWSVDVTGRMHTLRAVPSRMSIPELRWSRSDGAGPPLVVSLRAGIALLENYEPFCRHTRAALARFGDEPSVSTTVLETEFLRVLRSPIVLNRALREAVLERVQRRETTMSEIAMRCGRLKRDAKGNRSGETSWLARRIGLLPEGGNRAPTPWVHSDVLALIARDGLGIAPREVELG